MSGAAIGGKKAAQTNKSKYGKGFYAEIGRMGGSVSYPETRPFYVNREKAGLAGKKGGQISKRGPTRRIVAEEIPRIRKPRHAATDLKAEFMVIDENIDSPIITPRRSFWRRFI